MLTKIPLTATLAENLDPDETALYGILSGSALFFIKTKLIFRQRNTIFTGKL